MSYSFFQGIFEENLQKSKARQTYRGFYVYAIDATDFDLPASNKIIGAGYRGSTWSSGELETYYPKMYSVIAYDVVNDLIRDFSYSTAPLETRMAREMNASFEKNSICIYDRLYCGYPLFTAHEEAGNYYLVRCRNKGKTNAKPVKQFIEGKSREAEVVWHQRLNLGLGKGVGLNVRLVKLRNPRTKQDEIFATNLPIEKFTRVELGKLYRRRWDIELAFRDLKQRLKIGQWHSKSINGILQEIYTLLWFTNAVKSQLRSVDCNLLEADYKKSNFKMCAQIILENIGLLIRGKISKLRDLLELWIRRTSEKRKRLSRRYDRTLRRSAQTHNFNNQVPRRPKMA